MQLLRDADGCTAGREGACPFRVLEARQLQLVYISGDSHILPLVSILRQIDFVSRSIEESHGLQGERSRRRRR